MVTSRSTAFTGLSDNERSILNIIRRRRQVSRAQITNITNLTSASVTRIAQGLVERGLIEEMDAQKGARGQPARPLRLRADAAFAVGLNFSHTRLDAVLVDFIGEVRTTVPTAIENTALETIVAAAQRSCRVILESGAVRSGDLVGVGVSIPGYRVERPDRFALHPMFSSLLSRNLADDFRGQLSVPVIIERDAVSAAIGESLVGHGRDRNSFGFVHLGHGIGGALILNGEPFRGAFGNAGGIGDLFPRKRDRPSGSDLLAHLRSHGHDLRDFAELESLSDSARTVLDDWIERAGVQLRDGLAVFARIFDPHAIIIGGRLPKFICRKLVDRITPLPRPDTYTEDLPQPVFEVSTHGPLSGAIGAACLPLFEHFFSMARRD